MAQGKRYKAAAKTVEELKFYTPADAVKLVKGNAKAKFDETIEITINTTLDTKQGDQTLRGMVQMPNGTGKDVKVAVFAKGDKADAARAAGAELVGDDDLAEKILAGESGFDRVIATPDMMMVVGKLGKVLGPRGLMPNPKLGTVTPNVVEAIKAAKGGSVEFRAEKAGIVHAGIGKASFTEEQLLGNLKAFVTAVNRAKPSGAKGAYIKKIGLSSTMGPGVKIDLTELLAQAG